MFLLESKAGAILCMLLALVFLGTWPALLTLLERKGRLPQHTYLDYALTNMMAAVTVAFLLGEIGQSTPEHPNFLVQLKEDNWPSVLIAITGGVMLSLGNLSVQYALALVGLSVTEVISASITVVIGTTLNYFLDGKINRAEVIFPGVACFLAAVGIGSLLHSSNAADNLKKINNLNVKQGKGDESESKKIQEDVENEKDAKTAAIGSADYLMELESKRAIKVMGKNTYLGLGITFFAGICYSLFSPLFNLATNDQFNALKPGVPHLTVYTAFFYFSISFFILAFILNVFFLYRPILDLPKSSIWAYLNDWNGRGWAFLAGIVCGFGNGLQFMGGQAAGYAAADAVQALPLVSTVWGVVLFGEYRRSSKKTYILLAAMLVMFAAAVSTLIASAGERKS